MRKETEKVCEESDYGKQSGTKNSNTGMNIGGGKKYSSWNRKRFIEN